MSVEITRKGYNIKVLTVVEGTAKAGEYTITKFSDSVEANLLFEILDRLDKMIEAQTVYEERRRCEHGIQQSESCNLC